MSKRNHVAVTVTAGLLLGVIACRSDDAAPPVVDRAVMHALRDDAARIARGLSAGRLEELDAPALRLAEARVLPLRADDAAAPDEELLAYERSFRVQAARLLDVLKQDDPRAAEQCFNRLLDRCDACHVRFRPGGLAGR